VAIAIVTTTNLGYLGTSEASGSWTIPAAITGDSLFVVISVWLNQVTSITLGTQNLLRAVSNYNSSNTNEVCEIWYLPAVLAANSGVTTMSFTASGAGFPFVCVYNASGFAAGAAVDQTNSSVNASSSTSWTSGSIGTTTAAELLIGGVTTAGQAGALTGPAGFTNTSVYPSWVTCGTDIVAATGTYSYAGTEATTDFQGAVIASFKNFSTVKQPNFMPFFM
jgi:hypothetical protein